MGLIPGRWRRGEAQSDAAPTRAAGDAPAALADVASAPEHVAPLTRERLASRVGKLGYHALLDAKRDVSGLWSGRLFSFYLLGQDETALQVRGRWQRRVALERLPEVLSVVNAWNRDHLFPKCYVRVLDDGMVHVLTEVSTPWPAGITDSQLDGQILLGLMRGTEFFNALEARWPDPISLAPDSRP